MNNSTPNIASADISSGGAPSGSDFNLGIHSTQPGDADDFRAALDRHMAMADNTAPGGAAKENISLGKVIADRTVDLASEVKKDQQYVSKLLERATRTGNELHLMQAMMAMSDFQVRVQTISKTVSKASTSIDSLTKLQ
ncbi:MAG: hrpB [Burkholderia sp.]|nr:hrpB [Burkholderia sp.]